MASPFSGTNGRNTAVWTANYLGGVGDKNNQNYDTGLKNSVGALSNARGALGSGMNNQTAAVNSGADAALGRLGQAADVYRPAYARGEQASSAYMDSLGFNGAEGFQRDVNAFQAGPGYAFQRDQAADLAARKASSLGIAGSGNTLSALTTLGSNLANQEYGARQNRLQALGQQGQQAGAGIASALTGMAGIDMTRGGSLSGIYGQNASGMAGTYGNEAGLYSQDASNRVNSDMAIASQIVPAGQAGFKAGDNAAANRMNAGMQGLQLGAQLLGSFAGAPGAGAGGGTGGMPGNMGLLKMFAGT